MKNLASIGLLFLYMTSIMHPNELLKIPFFIQHYKIHKSQNDRINIWSFLCDHYTKGNHKEVDYEEDMKLPFKIPQNCVNNFSFFANSVKALPQNIAPILMEANYILIRDIWCRSAIYLNAIWQPPKSDVSTLA